MAETVRLLSCPLVSLHFPGWLAVLLRASAGGQTGVARPPGEQAGMAGQQGAVAGEEMGLRRAVDAELSGSRPSGSASTAR